MGNYVAKDFALSTLAGPLTDTATTATVQSGHGNKFPIVANPDYSYLVLEDEAGNFEVIELTAHATNADSMTISRGQMNTAARSWAAGTIIECRPLAQIIADSFNHVTDALAAHAASAIINTPAGNIASVDVQAALNELDTLTFKKSGGNVTGDVLASGNLSVGGSLSFSGSPGIEGKPLVSMGAGASPEWKLPASMVTSTTGSGPVDITDNAPGASKFVAAVAAANACDYRIDAGAAWEVGIGTVAPTTTGARSFTYSTIGLNNQIISIMPTSTGFAVATVYGVYTTTDGVTLTSRSIPDGVTTGGFTLILQVMAGSGDNLALFNYDRNVWLSTDGGVTWVLKTNDLSSPYTGGSPAAACFGSGKWLVNMSDSDVYYSATLTGGWTRVSVSGLSSATRGGMAYNGSNQFALVGAKSGGGPGLWTSDNSAASWTLRSTPFTSSITNILWDQVSSKWVLVGDGGAIAVTANGDSFDVVKPQPTPALTHITTDGTFFYGLDSSNKVYASSSLVSWAAQATLTTLPSNNNFGASPTPLAIGSGKLLAAGKIPDAYNGTGVLASASTAGTPVLQLIRSAVTASSSGNAAVSFSAGTKFVEISGRDVPQGTSFKRGSISPCELILPNAADTLVGRTTTDTLTNKTLTSPVLTSPKETRAAPTISGGTLTLDLSTANVFDVSLNANITTLTISNVAASGTAHGFTLTFTADGTARSVSWPASFKWDGGTAPTLTSTSGKKDIIAAYTTDGGTTWLPVVVGQNK